MKITKYLTFILILTTVMFLANGFAEDSPKSIKVDGTVNDIKYSPDGTLLAVATSEGLWIYDIGGNAKPTALIGHEGQVLALAWSDSQTLASGGDDKTVRLWDVRTAKMLKNFKGHKGRVNVLAFSPDGRMIASSSRYKENFSKLYDKPMTSMPDDPINSPSDLHDLIEQVEQERKRWEEEDKREDRLRESFDNTIHLWNTNSVKHLKPLNISGTALAFRNNKTLAIASNDSRSNDSSILFQLYDVETGKSFSKINFSIGRENIVKLDSSGIRTTSTTISTVVFSLDGTKFAMARVRVIASDGSNRYQNIINNIINIVNGGTINIKDAKFPVATMAFSPNGSYLATGSADKTIQLIDIKKRKSIRTLNKHTDAVTALAFSKDGTLASGSKDGTVLIWKNLTSK
ncbi:hypothetical protein C6501_09630 [Candidatus Poribacteria bacterium]|nr:MAG: hypothetical protein C6501_09630 [Candidatus Poribacteria bacterium]